MSHSTLDVRAQLRAALARWPRVDQPTSAYLATLPWRVRRAVVLVYGHRYSLDEAAVHLAVHRATIGRYLSTAYKHYRDRQSSEN